MSTWKAAVSSNVNISNLSSGAGDDDWETDPDFVNDVTEEEQRWGSKTVEGSGRIAAALNIQELRHQVTKDNEEYKRKEMESGPKASFGYGGKFGVQQDRMDKSAVGHDYVASVQKHTSQTDSVKGFGGKFGVQKDRQDKSAVGWEYHEKLEKHASQKDYVTGFGGKYGVQKDRVDTSAVGWDHHEKTEKHASQIDYSQGFGGKYGVQKERQDKCAVGWEFHEKTEKHASQTDYSKGFGGKYGVQTDRKDKVALGWEEVTKTEAHPSQVDMKKGFGGKFGVERDKQDKSAYSFDEVEKPKPAYEKPKPDAVGSERARNLRAKFENMAKDGEEEARKMAEEERKRREEREKLEKEEAKRAEEQRQKKLKEEHRRIEQLEALQKPEGSTEERPESRSMSAGEDDLIRPKDGIKKDHSRVSVIPRELVMPTKTSPEEPVAPEAPASLPTITTTEPEEPPSPAPVAIPGLTEPRKIIPQIHHSPVESESSPESAPGYEEEQQNFEDIYEQVEPSCQQTNITAVALYDYQAADYDEISFDPEEVIKNIEMIDEGWWRGECNGKVGLFPANYVQLLNQ